MFEVHTLLQRTADLRHPLIELKCQNGQKYLFGSVPEGAQRMMTSNSVKISKVKAVFLTGKLSWGKLSGLPGFILSVSDLGLKGLSLYHGTDLLSYFVANWRAFVFRHGIDLKVGTLHAAQQYQDDTIKVTGFRISSGTNSDDPQSSVKLDLVSKIINHMFPFSPRDNVPNTSEKLTGQQLTEITELDPNLTDPHINRPMPLPATNAYNYSTNYLIEFEAARGKFLHKKAVDLGVKPGLDFRQLVAGKPVILENGSVVLPEQVLSEKRLFLSILVLDIPNMANLKNITASSLPLDTVNLIYYFLAPEVSPQSKEFLDLISSLTHVNNHVISHPTYLANKLNFPKQAAQTLKLKCLQPENYRLQTFGPAENSVSDIPVTSTNSNFKLYLLDQFQKFNIKYDLVINYSKGPPYENPANYWNRVANEEEVSSESLQSAIAHNTCSDAWLDDVQIWTLGTGSALPSAKRNVIGNIVRVPQGSGEYFSYVLDAGENTIGTLRRTFTAAELTRFFQDELKVIYLSHLHGDHHFGIMSLIQAWCECRKPQDVLHVISPWQYEKFVDELVGIDEYYADTIKTYVVFISCEDFLANKKRPASSQIIRLYQSVGIHNLQTCRAHHCSWSYSVTFTVDLNGRPYKFSFSGDTRPTTAFVKIGKESDLLIHEATLGSDLKEMAIAKNHSTMAEAIEVGQAMKADKVILTHFSQRYHGLPLSSLQHANIELAFDGMMINHKDIGTKQLKVFPELERLFGEELKPDTT